MKEGQLKVLGSDGACDGFKFRKICFLTFQRLNKTALDHDLVSIIGPSPWPGPYHSVTDVCRGWSPHQSRAGTRGPGPSPELPGMRPLVQQDKGNCRATWGRMSAFTWDVCGLLWSSELSIWAAPATEATQPSALPGRQPQGHVCAQLCPVTGILASQRLQTPLCLPPPCVHGGASRPPPPARAQVDSPAKTRVSGSRANRLPPHPHVLYTTHLVCSG